MTHKIKTGDYWTTYALVSDFDPDLWFTMNINPDDITMIPNTHIEQWEYLRTEAGDKLINRRNQR